MEVRKFRYCSRFRTYLCGSKKQRMQKLLTIIGFAAALGFVACQNNPSSDAAGAADAAAAQQANAVVEYLNAEQFAAKLTENPNLGILDLRTPEEFKRGHIYRAINMNSLSHDFPDRLIDLDENMPIAVYDFAGDRIPKATALMEGLGYKKVYVLVPGLGEWRRPVVKGDQ